MRFIDPDGRAPGDLFKTINTAALDWGKYYNGASILRGKEFGSTIYEVKKDGKTFYSYSVAAEGTASKVKRSEAPNGETRSAIIHSHGEYLIGYDNNNFSTQDKWNARNLGVNSYVATPDGSLKKYDQSSTDVTTFSTNLPSDPKDPNRKNKIDPVDIPLEKKKEEIKKEQEKKPDLPMMSNYSKDLYKFVF